jgi:hypothetical protein
MSSPEIHGEHSGVCENDFRKEAEKHWAFLVPLLIDPECDTQISFEKAHYLYVEAMVHGYKHAKEEIL